MSKLKIQGDAGGTGIFTLVTPDSDTNRTITLPDVAGLLITTGYTTTAAMSFVIDEDNLASDLATKVPTQQSVKAYVDAQIATEDTLTELNDTNITSPADASLLLYDTGTSTWRDAAMSGDATIGDTGVITIAANAVDSAEIVAGAIDTAHIAADNIVGSIIADNTLDSEHYAAGSIDTAHLGDDQVTLAKMAGIARGKIIYGDASGNPAALAVGSSGQALTSDGTDVA